MLCAFLLACCPSRATAADFEALGRTVSWPGQAGSARRAGIWSAEVGGQIHAMPCRDPLVFWRTCLGRADEVMKPGASSCSGPRGCADLRSTRSEVQFAPHVGGGGVGRMTLPARGHDDFAVSRRPAVGRAAPGSSRHLRTGLARALTALSGSSGALVLERGRPIRSTICTVGVDHLRAGWLGRGPGTWPEAARHYFRGLASDPFRERWAWGADLSGPAVVAGACERRGPRAGRLRRDA